MDWISYFIAYLPWPPTDPCNSSMQLYVGVPVENLTDDQQSEILYCFLARYWNNRTDNATALPPSPCDKIVVGYMNTTWRAMDLTTQALIRDCLDQRTFIDKLRMQGNMSWIPSDWMYNWDRRLVFPQRVAARPRDLLAVHAGPDGDERGLPLALLPAIVGRLEPQRLVLRGHHDATADRGGALAATAWPTTLRGTRRAIWPRWRASRSASGRSSAASPPRCLTVRWR